MNTRETAVAAFCSHGNQYKRFRASPSSLSDDVDRLLHEYGASVEMRKRLQELLQSPDFAGGFRFESTYNYSDPERTVVYACLPNPYLDADLEPAFDAAEDAQQFVNRITGAWRRSA